MTPRYTLVRTFDGHLLILKLLGDGGLCFLADGDTELAAGSWEAMKAAGRLLR